MFVKNQTNQFVELEIARFHRSYRKRLRRLTAGSPPLQDLIVSFPAAAFALVSGYGTVEQRGRTVALVKSGGGLKAVAETLGLAFWMRKLPPEAFARPLSGLPTAPDFGRRVGHLVPKEADVCAAWLDAVVTAYERCDADFAAWVAAQHGLAQHDHPGRLDIIRLLAAFAWYSQSGNAQAAELIDKRWTSGMACRSAQRLSARWAGQLIGAAQVRPVSRGPGRYSARNRLAGFAIVPLCTANELQEEGWAMNHCVASYASEVEQGHCLIFGIRQDGQRVATVEVRGRQTRTTLPRIVQIQGPGNASVPQHIVKRVQAWLLANASDPIGGAHGNAVADTVDQKAWVRLWAPYADAKPGVFQPTPAPNPARLQHVATMMRGLAG